MPVSQKQEERKDKIKAVFSFGGGYAFLIDKGLSPLENFEPKSSFQLSALVPLGKFSGLRFDMGFSQWLRNKYEITGSYDYYSYNEQKKHCYYFKTDFILGNLTKMAKFWFFVSAGFGMSFSKAESYLFKRLWDDPIRTLTY
ncbi:MAG TPA: hypothetical protein VGK25_10790, partial [Ignavibacteria bacterium]